MTDDRQTDGDKLDRRLAEARAELHRGVTSAQGRAESRGWAIGIEFVGAVLVGGFIGWLIDRWADTAPWLMIVFLLLGFAAGLRRVMKTNRQFDSEPGNDQ